MQDITKQYLVINLVEQKLDTGEFVEKKVECTDGLTGRNIFEDIRDIHFVFLHFIVLGWIFNKPTSEANAKLFINCASAFWLFLLCAFLWIATFPFFWVVWWKVWDVFR